MYWLNPASLSLSLSPSPSLSLFFSPLPSLHLLPLYPFLFVWFWNSGRLLHGEGYCLLRRGHRLLVTTFWAAHMSRSASCPPPWSVSSFASLRSPGGGPVLCRSHCAKKKKKRKPPADQMEMLMYFLLHGKKKREVHACCISLSKYLNIITYSIQLLIIDGWIERTLVIPSGNKDRLGS